MENDIGRVLLVPGATKLHRNSRHRLPREGMVAASAGHHPPFRAALRTLVVRLFVFQVHISRDSHVVLL